MTLSVTTGEQSYVIININEYGASSLAHDMRDGVKDNLECRTNVLPTERDAMGQVVLIILQDP